MDKSKQFKYSNISFRLISILLFIILTTTSCKKDNLSVIETNDKTDVDKSLIIGEDTYAKFKAARDAFYDGIPSAYDMSNYDIDILLANITPPPLNRAHL